MKAAVIHRFGDSDELRLEEISTPEPKPGHVVIKVLAAGVNRLDYYLREGSVVPDFPFPHILGSDAAGEIAALGEGVTGFELGQRVIPSAGFPLDDSEYGIYPNSVAPSFTLPGLGVPGTYAQYVEIPAAFVLMDDTGLSPEQVATLPVALGTAVRAVKEIGEVKAGQKVLVHAGASKSGSMQIQVARALGAEVATTVRSESSAELTKSLGASLAINTREQDFVERVMEWTDGRGVDVVIDNLGGDVLAKSLDAVRVQGIVVAFGFTAGTEVTFDIRNFFFGQKQLRGSMANDIQDLKWGLEQVRNGNIRPVVDRVLPLSEAAEAHRLIEANGIKGGIVLQPWAN